MLYERKAGHQEDSEVEIVSYDTKQIERDSCVGSRFCINIPIEHDISRHKTTKK